MSISNLKLSAREYMRQNAPKLFFVTLIYVIVITLLPLLSAEISGVNAAVSYIRDVTSRVKMPDWTIALGYFRPFGVLLSIVIALSTIIINVGFLSYSLKISRGKDGDYMDLLDGFMMFGKIIALSILMGIFIFLWSLLFIIPGIVAAYRYSQAYFIMLDSPELGALECIRKSKQMMIDNKLDLFLLNLSFIGWSLLGGAVQFFVPYPIVTPLLYIWLQPYMTISQANFYNYLIRYNPETAVDAGETFL